MGDAVSTPGELIITYMLSGREKTDNTLSLYTMTQVIHESKKYPDPNVIEDGCYEHDRQIFKVRPRETKLPAVDVLEMVAKLSRAGAGAENMVKAEMYVDS